MMDERPHVAAPRPCWRAVVVTAPLAAGRPDVPAPARRTEGPW